MLTLSRKLNESIMINNDIEITIAEIKGDQVKIGITAPKEIPIYRKELYLQIQEANKEANAQTNPLEVIEQLFQS
ncbi:MAG: carbon storage regulator CsrA [Lachnospiraceae bacterium]|nr:carbon storage regulator CsrA [Lachnospiraceae bacterium]MEE1342876.1 carbon storage regulator CsrA [Lachnospiraceae bacterium]